MNIWIEKLRAAPTKIERDEILLRDFWNMKRFRNRGLDLAAERAESDVEDQLRALADLAFDSPTVL